MSDIDPGASTHLVRLSSLPLCYVRRSWGKDLTSRTSVDPETAGEQLAIAGYSVVAFVTPTGRDVQCVPMKTASGEPGIAWQVEAHDDDH